MINLLLNYISHRQMSLNELILSIGFFSLKKFNVFETSIFEGSCLNV